MKDLKEPFGDQIADVYRVLADEYAERRLESDRRRAEARINRGALLIDEREPARGHRLFSRRFLPALAAVLAGSLAFAGWLLSPGPLLEYTVEGARAEHGTVKTENQPAWVHFSDESELFAAPRTTLQIDVVGERAALARLVQGSLNVSVRHAEKTDWRFLAGPYEVRVVGTKFDLAWDAFRSRLSLVMHEGQVRVVGAGEDRVLVGGQRLDLERDPAEPVTQEDDRASVTANTGEAPAPTADASAPARSPARGSKPALPARGGATHAHPQSSSWSALVAAGRFEEVVQKAQLEGTASVHAKRPPHDLRALAQAASYTGRSELSAKTWLALRNRSRGRNAEQAAFFLGRTLEQQGKPSEALHWLRTYLREAPQGVYAAEALGEVLTLVRRMNGTAPAQPIAKEYLERFPKGSYAAAARAVLDGQ